MGQLSHGAGHVVLPSGQVHKQHNLALLAQNLGVKLETSERAERIFCISSAQTGNSFFYKETEWINWGR